MLEVGSQSLSVMIFTLLTAFAVALYVGKLLKLERSTTTLIGAGTAICGGSAIAAVAPVIGARDRASSWGRFSPGSSSGSWLLPS